MPLEVIFFAIKLTGIICVTGGCAGMGVLSCRALNQRADALMSLHKSIMYIYGTIRCSASPLPEVMEAAAQRSGKEFQLFFSEVSRELRSGCGKSFKLIWEENIQKHLRGGALAEEDLTMLKKSGADLGSHDTKMQLAYLEKLSQEITDNLEELKMSMADKKRIYAGLWGALGVFIVIILI